MFDPAKPSIAVACVLDSSGRLLLAWNQKWGAFTVPMTKIDLATPAETPQEAAVRAAAEVLQVPCRPVADKPVHFFRGLQKSERDAEIKDYQYNIVLVESHPDFAAQPNAGVWASIEKIQSGEYQPISGSVEEILRHCLESGLVQ